MEHFVVPEKVAVLNKGVLQNNGIKKLELSNINEIRDFALNNLYSLTGINISNKVKNFSTKGNLVNCKSLKSINLNIDGISVDGAALYSKDGKTLFAVANLEGNEKFTIRKNVERIGEYAFYQMSDIKNIDLTDVKFIDENAFAYCGNLKDVVFPASVKAIYKHAFKNCKSIESVVIPGNDTIYAAFTDCAGIKSVTIESNNEDIQYFRKNILINTYPETLIIKNQNPPVVLKDTDDKYDQKVTWDKDLYSVCTLTVPSMTADKYKDSFFWDNFVNIEESK